MPSGFLTTTERFNIAKEHGVPRHRDALELALLAMIEGYDRLLCVMPEGTLSHRLAVGSFGKSAEVAKEILGIHP